MGSEMCIRDRCIGIYLHIHRWQYRRYVFAPAPPCDLRLVRAKLKDTLSAHLSCSLKSICRVPETVAMPRAYQYFTCSSHILTDGRTGAEKTSIESMHLIPRRSRARWACDYDWRQSGFGVSIRATKEHTHRPSTCRSRQ